LIKTVSGHLLGGLQRESWGRKKGKQYYGTGHSFVFCDHQAIIPGYDAEWILQSYISTVGQATTIVQICNFGEQSWPWAVWVILVWLFRSTGDKQVGVEPITTRL
jgi:hypothetical protein